MTWSSPALTNVAEADGGDGDEAEVEGVHEGPALPQLHQAGATGRVAKHDDQDEEDGDPAFAVVHLSLVLVLQVALFRSILLKQKRYRYLLTMIAEFIRNFCGNFHFIPLIILHM
jgi:hypothetical protein